MKTSSLLLLPVLALSIACSVKTAAKPIRSQVNNLFKPLATPGLKPLEGMKCVIKGPRETADVFLELKNLVGEKYRVSLHALT